MRGSFNAVTSKRYGALTAARRAGAGLSEARGARGVAKPNWLEVGRGHLAEDFTEES